MALQRLRPGFPLLLLLVASVLSACGGFHLRGAGSPNILPLQGQVVFVQGVDVSGGFGAVLAQTLREHGALLVGQPDGATVGLVVGKLDEGKTVSAYSSARQVREFNHSIELAFSAKKLAGNTPEEVSSSVRAERLQTYDSRYVLGSAEEERGIKDELRKEAARLLAVRLGALR